VFEKRTVKCQSPPGVQDRQPGFALWIEAPGGDLAQRASRRLGEVFPVHIEQEADWRAGGGPVLLEAAMAEPLAECALDRERTPGADAVKALKASVMGSLLQLFERVDVEFVVDFSRKRSPDPGDGSEKFLWLQGPAEPVKLAPASGLHDLDDGRADATPNAGQFHEALTAPAAHDLIDGAVQLHQGSCRPSISRDAKPVLILKLEDVSHLAQLIRDDSVTRTSQRSTPSRKASRHFMALK